MKIIDAHTHLGIRDMPARCWEFVRSTKFDPKQSAKNVVDSIKSSDVEIEKIVLMPSYPCGSRSFTDGVYDQAEWAKGFSDIFLQFGTINPNCDGDVTIELENQYSKIGIVGLKLHPVHHCFKPNSYRPEEGNNNKLERIYEFAINHSLPVTIHTGTSVTNMARNKYGDPMFVDDVAKDFPRLRIILAHAGRPLWCDSAFYLARFNQNVYLELSSIPPGKIRSYLPRIDTLLHKAIYGSDCPDYGVNDIVKNAMKFSESFCTDQRVLHSNFLSLLPK
jgi:predicted TIM-barrel fold metal-dependent hydrolase